MTTLAEWRALTDPSPHGIKRQVIRPADQSGGFGIFPLLVVPGDQLMRVVMIRFAIVTTANVANRVVSLFYQAGGARVYTVAQTLTQTASQTVAYNWLLGYNVVASGGVSPNTQVTAPLPDLILQPGWSVGVSVVGISGADALNTSEMTVEQVDTLPVGATEHVALDHDALAQLEHAWETTRF